MTEWLLKGNGMFPYVICDLESNPTKFDHVAINHFDDWKEEELRLVMNTCLETRYNITATYVYLAATLGRTYHAIRVQWEQMSRSHDRHSSKLNNQLNKELLHV